MHIQKRLLTIDILEVESQRLPIENRGILMNDPVELEADDYDIQ